MEKYSQNKPDFLFLDTSGLVLTEVVTVSVLFAGGETPMKVPPGDKNIAEDAGMSRDALYPSLCPDMLLFYVQEMFSLGKTNHLKD